jgi:hypothetical protein
VGVHPLANLILALVAPQPSESADMVRALRPLRHAARRTDFGRITGLPEGHFAIFGTGREAPAALQDLDLGQTLEWIIERVAEWKASPDDEHARNLQRIRDLRWRIEVAPSLLTVWFAWRDKADGVNYSDEYQHPQGILAELYFAPPVRALIRRSVQLPFALIESAAELLLDTARATTGDLLNPGRAGSATAPERETPTPATGSALQTNQLPKGTTGPLDTPEPNDVRETAQLSCASISHRAAGLSSSFEGSDHDRGPPHSLDAAAA